MKPLVVRASDPKTSVAILRGIARMPLTGQAREEALRALAANPSSPADVLAVVARRTRKKIVLEFIAANPNADTPLLEHLVDAHHRNPLGNLMWLACQHPNAPVHRFQSWSRAQSPSVRKAIAGHPRTSPAILADMATREDVRSVLETIVANPATPEEAAVAAALLL